MRNRLSIFCLLSFLLVMLVTSCAGNDTQTTSTPIPMNEAGPDAAAYPVATETEQAPVDPYPGTEIATPFPVTVEPAELPLDLPSPAPGLATVGGVVIDEVSRQAPPESLLYLGEVMYTDKGLPVVSVDRQNDPVVILPPNGEFAFRDVVPGEYSIVFFTPDYSFLLEDLETQESIIVILEENETLDLGLHELPHR